MRLRIAYCRRPVSWLHCRVLQGEEAVRRKCLILSKPTEGLAAIAGLAQRLTAAARPQGRLVYIRATGDERPLFLDVVGPESAVEFGGFAIGYVELLRVAALPGRRQHNPGFFRLMSAPSCCPP